MGTERTQPRLFEALLLEQVDKSISISIPFRLTASFKIELSIYYAPPSQKTVLGINERETLFQDIIAWCQTQYPLTCSKNSKFRVKTPRWSRNSARNTRCYAKPKLSSMLDAWFFYKSGLDFVFPRQVKWRLIRIKDVQIDRVPQR